jgi:hypothetical protein
MMQNQGTTKIQDSSPRALPAFHDKDLDELPSKRTMMKLPGISGLSRLVDFFETKPFPAEEKVLKSTVQIGSIRYRQCAFIFADKAGLYLRIKTIFKSHPVIFIPWTSIREKRKASLYGRKAIQLEFNESGLPPIKFYETEIPFPLLNDT